ncbi:MAG: ATP-binding protein [Cellvibrio sp.]|uniref:ATP-binding protein n=1 Tax=Cellvibrio sp. TaxID=1965322 RepID=UPI0031A844A0
MSRVGHVLSSAPDKVTIEIGDLKTFEENKNDLQVGRFIKIEDGNHSFAVAIINNISAQKVEVEEDVKWTFIMEVSPVGALIYSDNKFQFKRGIQVLPVPTEIAHTFDAGDLSTIFSDNGNYRFEIGKLSGNSNVPFFVDGDRFFGKHIGVVGSTGSGKSCAVASLIQSAVGISKAKNKNREVQKNSHVVMFDIHDEYSSAFLVHESENFNLNRLDVESIRLPYWLMNAEELESIFIEGGDQSSHNQISQFKQAVILNKERHNKGIEKITYDSPVFFSIQEVYNYIFNKNSMTVYEKDSKIYFAILGEQIEFNEDELWEKINFVPSTGNSKHKEFDAKVSKEGGFHGEFDRFISRLETKLSDRRLNFLLNPTKNNGDLYGTHDFNDVIKQFLGYIDKSNVTIVDLSGIPFEVLSITVSLISRLMFDFAFHYSKIMHASGQTNDIPFLIVCEEAHNYIPKTGGTEFKASRKSIERIAKEGRKYGLSLMVVSQRPSEVSETIFSQCNNFLALRLTNKVDQNYIKALLPDSSSNLIDMLPSLNQGEAFVVGDSVIIPSLVQLPRPNPEPKSASVDVFTEWSENWKDITFEKIVERWRKEG